MLDIWQRMTFSPFTPSSVLSVDFWAVIFVTELSDTEP